MSPQSVLEAMDKAAGVDPEGIFAEAQFEAGFGDLLRLLRLVRPVSRQPLPKGRAVLLEFQDDSDYLSATTFNYGMQRSVRIGHEDPVKKTRRILALASTLENAIRLLAKGKSKDDTVVIRQTRILGSPRIFVQADGYNLVAGTMTSVEEDAADWAESIAEGFAGKEPVKGVAFTWLASDLCTMMGRVKHAISTDETLPVLTCAQWEWESGKFTILSTDRYRLAMATMGRRSSEDAGSFQRLVALKDWNLIAPIIKDEDELSITAAGDDLLTITGEQCRISFFRTAGDYPNIKALFDERSAHTTVDRKELVRAAEVLAGTAERYSPLVLTNDGTGLQVAVAGIDGGESTSPRIPAQGHQSEPFAANPKFLIEALKAVPGDRVRFSWRTDAPGKMKPLMITDGSTPIKDLDLKLLVMPVRMPHDEPPA